MATTLSDDKCLLSSEGLDRDQETGRTRADRGLRQYEPPELTPIELEPILAQGSEPPPPGAGPDVFG